MVSLSAILLHFNAASAFLHHRSSTQATILKEMSEEEMSEEERKADEFIQALQEYKNACEDKPAWWNRAASRTNSLRGIGFKSDSFGLIPTPDGIQRSVIENQRDKIKTFMDGYETILKTPPINYENIGQKVVEYRALIRAIKEETGDVPISENFTTLKPEELFDHLEQTGEILQLQHKIYTTFLALDLSPETLRNQRTLRTPRSRVRKIVEYLNKFPGLLNFRFAGCVAALVALLLALMAGYQ